MPQIFDNIEAELLPQLRITMQVSHRSDFCVGYFNLRGWRTIDDLVENWDGGPEKQCRLLVGMHRPPEDELREILAQSESANQLDNQTALRQKRKLAQDFRHQLTLGIPTNEDEAGLRRLAAQLKSHKLVVKLFLRHTLHAKLYLLHRPDPINPAVAYLGSSNLTLSGLCRQGELNVDLMDQDATTKLAKWFNDRWNDRWCIDITEELIQVIEESWARTTPIPPYHIYVKMAYHLSQEARAGLAQFRIPREFGNQLFDYQVAAVKLAAHHLNKRGGVLIGDVVGLGKTLMATALAKIFQDDHFCDTLIICPKNLIDMWENYVAEYRLVAKVLSITRVATDLTDLRPYRLVLIDESHNLRNRFGKRFRAIQEYIHKWDCKCILLSATPYNKTYGDLSGQLRLFIKDDVDVGVRPEVLLRQIGEAEFVKQHQCSVRSLAAFEKSPYADDWRELMRLFLVRRTRGFIENNYAETDPETGRRYLTFDDGTRSYFPDRIPRTVKYELAECDQYAQLFQQSVVDAINQLNLPRYGLGNYVAPSPRTPPTQAEAKQLGDLSRAGKRLMGFSRTNLFKRLESSGTAFLLSIERHILRNYIYLHAIQNNLPIPIGTQDVGLLDTASYDEDADDESSSPDAFEDGNEADRAPRQRLELRTREQFQTHAAEVYAKYAGQYKNRFKWLQPHLFVKMLQSDLQKDADSLLKILTKHETWDENCDPKLEALVHLLTQKHPNEKVLIFSQFADTIRYLANALKGRGVLSVAGVTGSDDNPTMFAWRFSPVSNKKCEIISPEKELRVLIATDVLSEGQNLQDAAIVVNFDLPWAIIRLIQRAGRVDRIGQKSPQILCYSFLPADGIERIINLRNRVRLRLKENAEVIGTDEAFFEDQEESQKLSDLYNEKGNVLDGEPDTEVDLASYAFQIWKKATDADSRLKPTIEALPPVVYSTRAWQPSPGKPGGALVYLQTPQSNTALAWIGKDGQSITESQYEILRAAECVPDTPAVDRQPNHHHLVSAGVELLSIEDSTVGGQLGRPTSARRRAYDRLKHYSERNRGSLFDTPALSKAIEAVYKFPLQQSAIDTLNRQMRAGLSDESLADLVTGLQDDDRLSIIHEEEAVREPQIICSLGLAEE